jgi:hypothetical protein
MEKTRASETSMITRCRQLMLICNVLHLLITTNVVPSSLNPSTLKMEATRTSETSLLIGLIAFLRSMPQLLVTANAPSACIISKMDMEAICFSETSVLTRCRRRNILDSRMFMCVVISSVGVFVGRCMQCCDPVHLNVVGSFDEWKRRGTCIGYW